MRREAAKFGYRVVVETENRGKQLLSSKLLKVTEGGRSSKPPKGRPGNSRVPGAGGAEVDGGRDDWGPRMDSLQVWCSFDGQGGRPSFPSLLMTNGKVAGSSLASAAYRWSSPLPDGESSEGASTAAGRCKKMARAFGLSLHVIGLGQKGLRHPLTMTGLTGQGRS